MLNSVVLDGVVEDEPNVLYELLVRVRSLFALRILVIGTIKYFGERYGLGDDLVVVAVFVAVDRVPARACVLKQGFLCDFP